MGRSERVSWGTVLRRCLLALTVAVIAVCVVSMHQLSNGHSLATVDAAPHDHAGVMPATSSHAHADLPPSGHLEGPRGAPIVSALLHSTDGAIGVLTTNTHIVVADTSVWMTPAGGDAGCASCAPHAMLMATCLLALTLVVASWRLRSPQIRLMARLQSRLWRIAATGQTRLRPPLSLVELSLRRT